MNGSRLCKMLKVIRKGVPPERPNTFRAQCDNLTESFKNYPYITFCVLVILWLNTHKHYSK